jgi:hypothetical protein
MTGSLIKTDLYGLNHIVQNTMLSFSKNLLVELLRESFSKDSFYHYVSDDFGYPHVTDQTNLSLSAGLHDDATTRIFIGESYRYDQKYFPAILVKGGGFRYVPISFNRNKGVVQYKSLRYEDGYGNVKIFSTPQYFDMAGAWEGDINIEVIGGDQSSRDELLEIVAALIEIVHHDHMIKSGVFSKPLSISSPTETDDSKDKLYRATITVPVRTEWRQQIPIETVLDQINFCIDFGSLASTQFIPAANLAVRTKISIDDKF